MPAELIGSIVLILVLIFSGIGLPFCFLTGCIVYAVTSGSSMGTFIQTSFAALNSYSIIAMPMFMMAGTFIDESGIARTLIDAAEKILGRIKGGMAATIPLVACFFGALSGSGTATVTTLASMMVPRLNQIGYEKRYLAALVAAAGPLGYMIPPNVNALIFNRVSTASVSGLFLATIIPGLIWCVGFFIIIRLQYQKYYHPPVAGVSEADALRELEIVDTLGVEGAPADPANPLVETKKKGMWHGLVPAIMMPVIIMGGIYGGVFSATEAGAVGCLYCMLIGVLWFKKFTFRQAIKHFNTSAKSVGTIMILMPMTFIFSRILVINGIPAMLTQIIMDVSGGNKIIILLMVDLILFIAGFFVDCNVLQLVFVPLLLPLMKTIGVAETHLAVIMFVAIGVGTITPPMAMNIFIAGRIIDIPTTDIIKPIWPFVFGLGVPMMLIVTFLPELSLWLPRLILGTVQ